MIAVPPEKLPPIRLADPPALTPVVVASPHSGMHYPASFLAWTRLDLATLRRSEDCFVDSLLADAPSCGAPLLAATFPRVLCDVNRAKWELDPAMFETALPDTAITDTAKIRAGFGMMARRAGAGREIYAARLPVAEAAHRQEAFWQPYHQALQRLIDRALDRFGLCVLIDGHSMPRGIVRHGADAVLGDAYGTSCDPGIVTVVERALRTRGYRVARNTPYAGGYVTRHYGEPKRGVHVVQVEIARDLYMDETTLLPHDGFERIRQDMAFMLGAVVEAVGTSGTALMTKPPFRATQGAA